MQIRFVGIVIILLLCSTLLVLLSLMGATAAQIGAFLWLFILVALIGTLVINQIRQRPNRSH